MEVYYQELLSKPEELKRQIANVKDEDNIDLGETLKMLRTKAGANHPLTIAYEREFQRRQAIWVQKEVDKMEEKTGRKK